jgi:hypothetical protein
MSGDTIGPRLAETNEEPGTVIGEGSGVDTLCAR